MYSLQEVFKAANCPVDFETFFFSEVNPTMSARLEDVTASIKKNKICLKVSRFIVCRRSSHDQKNIRRIFRVSLGDSVPHLELSYTRIEMQV